MYVVDPIRRGTDCSVSELINLGRSSRPRIGQATSRRSKERWFIDQLRSGTLNDPRSRSRIVMGTFEAGGSCASGHEHANFDQDYPQVDMWEYHGRYYPPDIGPEIYDYKTSHAEQAADSIVEYSAPKWRIIRKSPRDKINRLAQTDAAEIAMEIDAKQVHYIDYDRFRVALELQEAIDEQREYSGPTGMLISPVHEYYDGLIPVQGSSDRLTGMKSRPTHPEATVYPALAASLLEKPSDYLIDLYRNNPQAGLVVREILEDIAAAGGDITEGDVREMNTLIRHHLNEMEVNRVFDPRMIHFVLPGGSREVDSGAIRSTCLKVWETISEESDEVKEAFETIIFPLAVHMRDRSIPITVENVIAEGDEMLQLRDTLSHLRIDRGTASFGNADGRRFGPQGCCSGPLEYIDHATDADLEILNRWGKEVVALLLPNDGPSTHEVAIYGEDDTEYVAQTMYGPRTPAGITYHAGQSTGRYTKPEQGRRVLKQPDQDVAPFTQDQRPQQLYYSPFTDGHELIRTTGNRRFTRALY